MKHKSQLKVLSLMIVFLILAIEDALYKTFSYSFLDSIVKFQTL